MWGWAEQHLPRLQPGTLEYGDLANLVVAAVAAVLAYVALRSAKKQESISVQLAQLAERQDESIRTHEAKRARLELRLIRVDWNNVGGLSNSYHLALHNQGDRPAKDIFWSMELPPEWPFDRYKTSYALVAGNTENGWSTDDLDIVPDTVPPISRRYGMRQFRCPETLYPGQTLPCCDVIASYDFGYVERAGGSLEIRWFIESSDGRFPRSAADTLKVPLWNGKLPNFWWDRNEWTGGG